jgi:DNA-binding transcriptional LysR family regulator
LCRCSELDTESVTPKGDTSGAAAGRQGRRSTPPAIELRHLRYFLAVFEELHFGRAAKRLRIAQPPLSQAIRKIESELGVQLFERTSRMVSATAAGSVLATEARKVLAAFDVAVAEARRAGGAASPLRIGCVPLLPIQPLLRFLGALHERDPNIRVQVTHLDFLEQARLLSAGELDLGIFHDAAGDHADFESEALFAGEPLAAFLPPGHALAARSVLKPEDVRSETLVVFPAEANPALHERLLANIEDAGYWFDEMGEASGMNPRDVMLSVAEGVGVALGPVSLQEVSDVGSIVLRRPLEPPVLMPDMVVAWRSDPPGRMKEKLSVVREVARELHAADQRD